jgi:hypothetical protein
MLALIWVLAIWGIVMTTIYLLKEWFKKGKKDE